jgi:uncharacterized cupin superfamily protein
MVRARLRELRQQLVLRVHGSGANVTAATALELEPQPIFPDWIDEGTPQARAAGATRSADGRITSGEWSCTAGRFRWTYYYDEVIRILSGEVFIEIDGVFRRFGPGDTIFFPMGQTVRWHVPSFAHKAFFEARPGNIVEFLRTFSVARLWRRPPPPPGVLS